MTTVLQESDWKLGWSLNTSLWYKQEYYRHLTTDFYQRFGTVEDVNLVKEKCRLPLSLILRKFRPPLTRKDFLSFHLGANLDDYILPRILPTLHAYADGTQLYWSCSYNVSTGEARANIGIESCIRDTASGCARRNYCWKMTRLSSCLSGRASSWQKYQ